MNAKAACPAFVDTNVLVYALVADGDERSPIARRLIDELMRDEALRTSTQVLQELFVTLTRKVGCTVTPAQALMFTDELAAWPVFAPEYSDVREAMLLAGSDALSFWDALILVAAARSGARTLYTADLQHGRKLLGVEIVNPFRAQGWI